MRGPAPDPAGVDYPNAASGLQQSQGRGQADDPRSDDHDIRFFVHRNKKSRVTGLLAVEFVTFATNCCGAA
jgi:hypothetical protein